MAVLCRSRWYCHVSIATAVVSNTSASHRCLSSSRTQLHPRSQHENSNIVVTIAVVVGLLSCVAVVNMFSCSKLLSWCVLLLSYVIGYRSRRWLSQSSLGIVVVIGYRSRHWLSWSSLAIVVVIGYRGRHWLSWSSLAIVVVIGYLSCHWLS